MSAYYVFTAVNHDLNSTQHKCESSVKEFLKRWSNAYICGGSIG